MGCKMNIRCIYQGYIHGYPWELHQTPLKGRRTLQTQNPFGAMREQHLLLLAAATWRCAGGGGCWLEWLPKGHGSGRCAHCFKLPRMLPCVCVCVCVLCVCLCCHGRDQRSRRPSVGYDSGKAPATSGQAVATHAAAARQWQRTDGTCGSCMS